MEEKGGEKRMLANDRPDDHPLQNPHDEIGEMVRFQRALEADYDAVGVSMCLVIHIFNHFSLSLSFFSFFSCSLEQLLNERDRGRDAGVSDAQQEQVEAKIKDITVRLAESTQVEMKEYYFGVTIGF
jgi:hypothetical protein